MTEYTTPETREVMELLINGTQPQTELDKQLERAEQEKIAYYESKEAQAKTLDDQQVKEKPQNKQVFDFRSYLNKTNNPVREIILKDADNNEVVFFARAPKFKESLRLNEEINKAALKGDVEENPLQFIINNYSLIREAFQLMLCDKEGNVLSEECIVQLEEVLPERMMLHLVDGVLGTLSQGKLGGKVQM